MPATQLFVSYAATDRRFFEDIEQHLKPLQAQGRIAYWHMGLMPPGEDVRSRRQRQLAQAEVILCLISADYQAQMQQELDEIWQRQRDGAKVVPVLVRPALLDGTPFASLKALPADGRPISNWKRPDDAVLDVVKGLLALIEPAPAPAQQHGPPPDPTTQPEPLARPDPGPASAPKLHAAILTAIDREREMVFEALRQQGLKPERYVVGGRFYHTFTLPQQDPRGQPVRALLAQATDKGGLAAQALVQDVVRQLHPELVLLAGVCGGFAGRMGAGDVLLARNLFYYEPAKLVPGKMELRPAPAQGSASVIELVRALLVEGALGTALDGAALHVKDYASGEKVIADGDAPLRQALRDLSPDIYGFEMEGAGMLHALWDLSRTEHVQAGIIKAASDLGDADMATDKDARQRRAALRAARVAIEVVRHFAYQR